MTRIIYRFEGGPLNGITVYHEELPENPEAPDLKRLTTCLEGEDIDMVAQGLYHLERRKIPNPFPLPPEPPADADDKVKQQMTEALEKAAEVFAQAAQFEWVAIHDKSDQDEDWHKLEKLEPKKVEEVAAAGVEVSLEPKPNAITIPLSPSREKRLKAIAEALKIIRDQQDAKR